MGPVVIPGRTAAGNDSREAVKFHQVESSGLESPGSGSGSWLEGAKPATPGLGRSGRFWEARWPSEAWALSCKVALPSVQAAPLPGEAGICCAFLGRRRLSLECHLHVSLSLPTPMSSFVWAVSSRVSPDSSDALHVKQRPFPRLSPTLVTPLPGSPSSFLV